MANKRPGKKKKGCCSLKGCLISLIVVLVLLVGVLVGGSAIAYNMFAKEYTGISYGEAIKLVRTLLKADGKQVGGYTYNKETDLAAFKKGIADRLYLENDDFDIAEMITAATGDGGAESILESLDFSGVKLREDLDNLYDEETGDYITRTLTITDKSIAALAAYALDEVAAGLIDIEAVADFTDYLDFLNIDRVSIGTNSGVAALADVDTEPDELINLKLVVSLDTRKLAKHASDTLVKEAAGDFVGGLANFFSGLLPKKTYVAADLQLVKRNMEFVNEGSLKLYVNGMSDAQMSTLLGIVKNIAGTDLEETINGVAGQVATVLESANKFVPLNFLDSKVSIEPIQIILSTLFTENEGEDAVTEEMLMKTLKALVAGDGVTVDESKKYTAADGDAFITALKAKYAIKDDFDITLDNFTDSDKLAELPNNISFKDGFNFDTSSDDMRVTLSGKQLAAIMESQLKTGDGEESFLDKAVIEYISIDTAAAGDTDYDYYINVMVSLNVKELIGAVGGGDSTEPAALRTLAGEGETEGEDQGDGDGEGSGGVSQEIIDKILDAFLPEKIYFALSTGLIYDTAAEEITNLVYATEGSPTDAEVSTFLNLNEIGKAETEDIISTVTKIMGAMGQDSSEFDIKEITKTVDKMLKEALATIQGDSALGINIRLGTVTEDGVKHGVLLLPSVYEVIQTKANVKDTVTTDAIRTTLKTLAEDVSAADVTETDFAGKETEYGDALINEVKTKYLIGDGEPEITIENFTESEVINSIPDRMTVTKASIARDPSEPNGGRDEHDNFDDMYVYIYQEYMSAIVNKFLDGNEMGAFGDNSFKFLETRLTRDAADPSVYYLHTVFEIGINSGEGGNEMLENLVSKLFITAVTRLTTNDAGELTDIKVAEADEDAFYDGSVARTYILLNKDKGSEASRTTLDTIKKLIDGFRGDGTESDSLDYNKLCRDIDKQLRSAFTSLNVSEEMDDVRILTTGSGATEKSALIMSGVLDVLYNRMSVLPEMEGISKYTVYTTLYTVLDSGIVGDSLSIDEAINAILAVLIP